MLEPHHLISSQMAKVSQFFFFFSHIQMKGWRMFLELEAKKAAKSVTTALDCVSTFVEA